MLTRKRSLDTNVKKWAAAPEGTAKTMLANLERYEARDMHHMDMTHATW